MKTVVVFGTFDSKGKEYEYLISQLERRGVDTISVDLGTMQEPPFTPTIPASEVAAAVGEMLESIHERKDRAKCLETMAQGTIRICQELINSGRVDGFMSMGGGQGTYLACKVMRELPIGVPKLILSTSATIPEAAPTFVGINDTLVVNSLVDIAGLNPILKVMLERVAGAMAGMMNAPVALPQATSETCRIAVSMWGVTTPCVTRVQEELTRRGCEVYVFHATGLGGRIMENLVEQGFFNGVIDVTLPEVSIPIIGGEYPYIPFRLLKIGETNVPWVVSVGGIDMVRFGAPFQLPDRFKNRAYYMHNEEQMFVRSNLEENKMVGEEIAHRLNQAKGAIRVVLPLKGISEVDKEGNVMYSQESDQALFKAISDNLQPEIEVKRLDYHINDMEFADYLVESILDIMKG